MKNNFICPNCNKKIELLVGSLINDGNHPKLYSIYCDPCWSESKKFASRSYESAVLLFNKQCEEQHTFRRAA